MTDDRPDVEEAVDRALDALMDAQHALSFARFNTDVRHARDCIERAERHLEHIVSDPPDPAA